MPSNIRIIHNENEGIEVGQTVEGGFEITVESFAGSFNHPHQYASIVLTASETARVVTYIMQDENICKLIASNYKGAA